MSEFITEIQDPKTIITTKKLGRLHSVDSRDKMFLLSIPKQAAGIDYRYWYSRGILDQSDTPYCVAYSGVKFLTVGPVRNKNNPEKVWLYNECQKVDEWEGEDYDGTSVRALFKVLKLQGYVSEYRWAFDVNTIVAHILTTGPVVFGCTWYNDMFTLKQGYLNATGGVAGGHAFLLLGANKKRINPDGTKGAVRMINSWGPEWGEKGRAWISFSTLQVLIDNFGEACTSSEILVSNA